MSHVLHGQADPEIIRESAGEFGYFHANDENLRAPALET